MGLIIILSLLLGTANCQLFKLPFISDLLGQQPLGGGPNLARGSPFAPQPQAAAFNSNPLGGRVPQLTDFVGNDNFGLPQGQGCIPFVGNFMRILFADCEQKVDTRTLTTWGDQVNGAIQTGKVNFIHAARETCKLQVERQLCGRLINSVLNCNILASLQLATELQQGKGRCDKITDLGTSFLGNQQTPLNQLLGGITNLVGGEVAGGVLNKFLAGGK